MIILLNLAESALFSLVEFPDGIYVFQFNLSGELMPISRERQLSRKHQQDLFTIDSEKNKFRELISASLKKIKKRREEEPMLAVREHCQQNTKILDLSGSFDASSKLGLEVAILGAKEMGCQHIILNFSEITWIDSMGLGQLFLWYHKMRPNHVHLSIVSPQPTVKDLLESTHLSEIVPIYQSEKEAVEAQLQTPYV